MPTSTGGAIAGSLFKGLAGGLEAFGQASQSQDRERAKTAEEKKKAAEARQKEIDKAERTYGQGIDFLEFRAGQGDPEAQMQLEELTSFNEGRAPGDRRLFAPKELESIGKSRELENQENEQILANLSDVGVDPEAPEGQFFGQFREEAGFTPAHQLTKTGREEVAEGVKPFFDQFQQLPDEAVVGQTQSAPGQPLSPEIMSLIGGRVGEAKTAAAETKARETGRLRKITAGEAAPTFGEDLASAEREKKIDELVGKGEPTIAEREVEADVSGRLDAIRAASKAKHLAKHGVTAKPKWGAIAAQDRKDILLAADEEYAQLSDEIKSVVGLGTIRNANDLRSIWKASVKGGVGWRALIPAWVSGKEKLSSEDRIALKKVIKIGKAYNEVGSSPWKEQYNGIEAGGESFDLETWGDSEYKNWGELTNDQKLELAEKNGKL